MGETNYMNTYVNLVVETVHGYLNDILQLKTQLSVINGLISEKDRAITSLEQELISLKEEKEKHEGDECEMQKLRDNAATWEFQYNNMMNKVSHMDTLTNQFNALKKEYLLNQEKLESMSDYESIKTELVSVKKKLERYTKKDDKKSIEPTPKKDINKEGIKSSVRVDKPTIMSAEDTKEIDDDF